MRAYPPPTRSVSASLHSPSSRYRSSRSPPLRSFSRSQPATAPPQSSARSYMHSPRRRSQRSSTSTSSSTISCPINSTAGTAFSKHRPTGHPSFAPSGSRPSSQPYRSPPPSSSSSAATSPANKADKRRTTTSFPVRLSHDDRPNASLGKQHQARIEEPIQQLQAVLPNPASNDFHVRGV